MAIRLFRDIARKTVASVFRWFNYFGTRVYFPPGSSLAKEVLEKGAYEREIMIAMRVAAKPGTTVFDVGANIGLSAQQVLHLGNDIKVISIEASPNVYECLERTHAGSPYRSRWEIVQAAATKISGDTVSFCVHRKSGDVFDGLRPTGRAAIEKTISVTTTTIDTEWRLRGCPHVSLIKVDTEGAEFDVLQGASECISTCKPTIVTEWYPKNFSAYGYEASDMYKLAVKFNYNVYSLPSMTRIDTTNMLPYILELEGNLLFVL